MGYLVSILVNKDVKDRLDSKKSFPEQTCEDVIVRLLDNEDWSQDLD